MVELMSGKIRCYHEVKVLKPLFSTCTEHLHIVVNGKWTSTCTYIELF